MINSNFSWILEQQFHSKINIVVFLLLNSIKSTIFVFSEQNLQYVYWNSLKTTVVLISHYGNDHRKADTERHTQPFLRHEFCWRSIFVRQNTCRRLSDSKSFFFFFNTSIIAHGKFRSPYLGKATAVAKAMLPIPTCVCSTFICIPTVVWLPILGIFNVYTDVNACDCIQGLCGHCKRICTEKWLGEKKIPCRIRETNLCQ